MEYVADFTPAEFVLTEKLSNRYFLVPGEKTAVLFENFGGYESPVDPNIYSYLYNVYPAQPLHEKTSFIKSLLNVSEWMLVPKPLFDLEGGTCNKIGVGYTPFRYQEARCQSKLGRYVYRVPQTIALPIAFL